MTAIMGSQLASEAYLATNSNLPFHLGHHPLTQAEILELLKRREQEPDNVELHKNILTRLSQGIRGSLWPRIGSNNPVHKQEQLLTTLYLKSGQQMPTPELAQQFYEIMYHG
jgi:hypothetical protein